MTVERTLPPDLHPDTLAVRVAIERSQYGENSEALYLTTGFVQPDSATSAVRFQSGEGYTYARTSNPTVTAFERRLAALEGTEAAIGAASGMGAILMMIMGLLKSGDHVILSRSMFGSTLNLFAKEFGKFGVETTFVSQTDVAEWRAARDMTERLRLEIPVADLQLGIMIEVPSAALLAPVLAREVDFFSVGTNDLTQYTLAIDRGHPTLSAQADGLHPAVLQLIDITVRAAHAHGKWVGVCGELAADPLAVPVLVGLGVDELSVSARSIPEVKARVRELSMDRLKTLAAEALSVGSPDEVRALVEAL